jgi:non-heme chloroperoxidase
LNALTPSQLRTSAGLATIDVPTPVIHGDSDAIVPLAASGARTADLVSDSTLVVVPGAPHGFPVTHPEVFNAELLSVLRR